MMEILEMLSGRWLEVAVAAYLIGMMLYGHYRGFIRIAVSVMSLFITLFAVRVAIPQTAAWLEHNTALYETMKESALKASGLDEKMDEMAQTAGLAGKAGERAVIESLEIPDQVKKLLIENNNGEIAVLFGQKGNPNITWETNTNLNIGTEFGFWNNRLSGSVDFFNRKTSDMLFAFSVPSSLGYSSYYANVGDMVNRGVEVELNADLIRTKNVLWSFNLNLTHVKNEVTYLAPEHKSTTVEGYKGYIDGSYFVGEGLPLYTYYLRSYAGVDPETGASLWYKDVKGDDGKITRTKTSDYTSATRYLHDSAIPSVYGGFSTSVSAYGVDFSISFNYQIGGKVYDSGYASFMSSPYGTTVGTNYHKDILKAWTPENKGSDIPRLQYGDQYTTSVSDRFLTDASYLNISNINVCYTLPSKITQKFGVQKLRVYLACDNVVYWSKRQGLDPRYSFTGATNFSNYSPIRTISGGVTVQF